MEGGEWKVEVEVGCPPWASVIYCIAEKLGGSCDVFQLAVIST